MMAKGAKPWVKPVIDYGPLTVFMAAYLLGGLFVATGALMAATLAAVVLAVCFGGRVPPALLLTAAVVGLFGGLTLWSHDNTFIKLKPTIIYSLFAAILGGGLASGRTLLKHLTGEALRLDDLGWRRLTLRFMMFFLVMAAANEVARRVLSDDLWVLWKVPGSIVATILFMMAQWRLLQRHRPVEE